MTAFVPSRINSSMTESSPCCCARHALAGFSSKRASRVLVLFTFLSYFVLCVVNLLTHFMWSRLRLDIKLEENVTLPQPWLCPFYGRHILCKRFFLTTKPDSKFPQFKTSFDIVWFWIKGSLERLELFPTLHKVRVFV